jgi:uncharacterized protein YndB with AHSA1/START domain
MPSATHSVTIARPPDEVFAFVADGENATRWRPGVLDVKHQSGEGVGAVYRQGVKGPGGRRIPADYEITAFEPGRRIAFHAIAGPVRPSGEYRFEPVAEGTRVTFSLDATVTGWKRLVMGRAVQSTMDAEMRTLETLKAMLES